VGLESEFADFAEGGSAFTFYSSRLNVERRIVPRAYHAGSLDGHGQTTSCSEECR